MAINPELEKKINAVSRDTPFTSLRAVLDEHSIDELSPILKETEDLLGLLTTAFGLREEKVELTTAQHDDYHKWIEEQSGEWSKTCSICKDSNLRYCRVCHGLCKGESDFCSPTCRESFVYKEVY